MWDASVRQAGRSLAATVFGWPSASGAAPGTAGLFSPDFRTNGVGGAGKQGTYTLSKGNDRPPCSGFNDVAKIGLGLGTMVPHHATQLVCTIIGHTYQVVLKTTMLEIPLLEQGC